jgi:hypothetical protein
VSLPRRRGEAEENAEFFQRARDSGRSGAAGATVTSWFLSEGVNLSDWKQNAW